MKTLISIVSSLIGINDNNNNIDPNDYEGNENTLRNLVEINTDDIIDYSIKRILPIAVFLVFKILGFIGWFICCISCCCNCFCCCCFKKKLQNALFYFHLYFLCLSHHIIYLWIIPNK